MFEKRVVIISQARTGSTRLPAKILKKSIGKTLLEHHVERLQRVVHAAEIVIATTINPNDDVIELLANQKQWTVYRGSEADVLDRYYQAAVAAKADIVVRVTSDCPVIDPALLDTGIQAYAALPTACDWYSNTFMRRTFPRGLDFEIFSFDALQTAWSNAQDTAFREHVTPYLYRNPALFKLEGMFHPQDYSQYRWTVDTPEDFELIDRIFKHFNHNQFDWQAILAAHQENPNWFAINTDVVQKTVN